MIKSVALIGACALALFSSNGAVEATPIDSVPTAVDVGVLGNTHYLLLTKALMMSKADGVVKCKAMNATLAPLTSLNIVGVTTLLSKHEHLPTYVASWNGDSYGSSCIALTPGTFSISTPDKGCAGPLPVLCAQPVV